MCEEKINNIFFFSDRPENPATAGRRGPIWESGNARILRVVASVRVYENEPQRGRTRTRQVYTRTLSRPVASRTRRRGVGIIVIVGSPTRLPVTSCRPVLLSY